MKDELCHENHTHPSSQDSVVKQEVRQRQEPQGKTEGWVVGRNGRIYKLKPDAHKRHELYSIWKGIRSRCSNPNVKCFKYYGGIGINVCKRWDDFKLFVIDMGPRPTKKHEIDRIDCSKGYEPENCKWSTRTEQLQNTRKNVYIEYNGQRLTLSNWARKLGIAIETLRDRILREWPLESALSSEKHSPGNGKKAWETRRRNLSKLL